MSGGRDIIRKQLASAMLAIEAAMDLLGEKDETAREAGPCSHPAPMRRPEPCASAPAQYLCRACSTLVNPEGA